MGVSGSIRTVAAFVTFALLLAIAASIALFGLFAIPACMCAPPPPGWHAVTSPKTVTEVVGPPLLVFLVGEYFALAPAGRQRRMIATGFVLVLSAMALAYCLYRFLPCCGEYAP